jgi:hypothetical protein
MANVISIVLSIALVLGVFFGMGVAIASIFCKERKQLLAVGAAVGIGLLFVVGGLIYAGCSKMGSM